MTIDIHLKHVEAKKTAQAKGFYQRKLMIQGMHSFKTAVALRKLQDIRKQKADEMRYNMLLRWSWNAWLQGCEHKEELRIYVQSRKARNHYKQVLLSRVISGWLEYTRWRQHRQAQYIKADAHCMSRLLPKCLHRIQMFAQMMRDKRFNQEQAVMFRRECLIGLFFTRWYHSYQTSLDVRMMERMAIVHYDHNVAQRMLITWKQRTQLQLQNHAKEDMAEEHYQVHLIKSVIQTWKAFTAESLKRQSEEYKAARHNYLCMLRKGWQGWTQFETHKKMKSSKLLKADAHYQHRLLQQTLDAWKVYSSRMKIVYEKVKAEENCHNLLTLRWTLARWFENARLQCEERRHLVLAEDHHRTAVLRKVVICWRQYAVLHAHKQRQKMDRLMQIRAQLDKGTCLRSFQAWRTYKDKALLQHLAESRAHSHYQRKLMHKTLHQWVHYRQLKIKKTLLQRQCAWLHNTRITVKYFLVWRAQHHAALAEQNKTTIALWQWSLVLQQKVLNAWVQYVAQHRHKKQRIAVAMEMRRQRLLREGVGQWLRVATDMTERREKKAAHQHAQTAYRSYNIVRRCAHHWRQKTLTNRHKRSRGMQLHPLSILHKPSSAVVRIGTGSIAFQPIDPKLPSLPKPSRMVPSAAHRASGPVKQQFSRVDFQDSTRSRPKPRRPDFMMESLQREGLWKVLSSQHSDIHPADTEDTSIAQAPASDEDEDAVDESLPRRQPPPPPSPQPKRLVQPSHQSHIPQLTDHSSHRLKCVDESRPGAAPVEQSAFADKQQMNQVSGDRTALDMDKAPFLMPPSAFTAKTDFDMRPSQGNEQLDANSRESNTSQTDPQRYSTSTGDNDIYDAIPVTGLSSPNHRLPPDTTNVLSDATTSAASRNYHLLSPDAFTSPDRTGNTGDVVCETGEHEEEDEDDARGIYGEEDIYKEILELKNQLLQYQQAKQRLNFPT
ncbi:uncharacterized protein [Amphiura filiformis]|uniref:uncharacterized protein n=1 Tax=Amphiura filiformis TaxID=82378 RepID=UPI003B219E63